MNLADIRARVDRIIAVNVTDPEESHAERDGLWYELLELYVPAEILAEVHRLRDADLTMWYS